MTPYGEISLRWELLDEQFVIHFEIPVSTECELVLPNGKRQKYGSGRYTIETAWASSEGKMSVERT